MPWQCKVRSGVANGFRGVLWGKVRLCKARCGMANGCGTASIGAAGQGPEGIGEVW